MLVSRRWVVPGLLAVGSWLAAVAEAGGGEPLLEPGRPIAEAVDHYLDVRLKAESIAPAPLAGDAELVRRLTLDLIGRVPTAREAREYVAATDPDKRTALVDRLLDSPSFAKHQAQELDAMMMAGTRGSLRDYLAVAAKENRPWDRVFREVVLADESDPGRKGSATFLKERIKDLDRLANDVSTTFFGINVSCAKCHDHPRVADWKQDHFYGMKAFFNRTYAAGNFLGERDTGTVKFQTTRGVERQAKMMFLTGTVIESPNFDGPFNQDPKLKRRQRDESKKSKGPPPPPRFSSRAQLVDVALRPGQDQFFSRAIVNRLWNRVFGSGLVMPLDQMHSANPPSHPELLDWLARDLVANQYDLRRLIRGLVLSRGYARSSVWEGKEKGSEAPDPRVFAVAAVRPLTPVQLATSLYVATTNPAALEDPKAAAQRIDALDDRARALAALLARPGEDYQIGASEALLMSNGDRVRDLLDAGPDRLVGRLAQVADPDERVTLAVRNVLSRDPVDDEASLLREFLSRRPDRPQDGTSQLVWALLMGSEFRFNH